MLYIDMKRLAYAATASLLAFNLAGCDTKSSPETVVTPSATPSVTIFDLMRQASTLTSEQIGQIEEAHDRNTEYWRARGEAAVAANTLVTLHGGATYRCKIGEHALLMNALSTARLCQDERVPGQSVTVITANSVNSQKSGILSRYFGDAHELGHAYQAAHDPELWDKVTAPNRDPKADVERELNATCLAGATLATYLSPTEIEIIRTEISGFPTDPIHGTGAQHADAFRSGVVEGKC